MALVNNFLHVLFVFFAIHGTLLLSMLTLKYIRKGDFNFNQTTFYSLELAIGISGLFFRY
jgi:hypothetical protein